jgi:hypothetical protein
MTTFHFSGLSGYKSKCGLSFEQKNGSIYVIMTELPDNPGTSITNMSAALATDIYQLYLTQYSPETIVWIEHYIYVAEESFDLVSYTWDGIRYTKPKWKHIEIKKIN